MLGEFSALSAAVASMKMVKTEADVEAAGGVVGGACIF